MIILEKCMYTFLHKHWYTVFITLFGPHDITLWLLNFTKQINWV